MPAETASDAVLVEPVRPGITKITLNRPDHLNAMSYSLVRAPEINDS